MRIALFVPLLLIGTATAPASAGGKPGVPDRKLQKAIDKAVERGAEFLRKMQQMSGGMGSIAHNDAKDTKYNIGTSALAGLALLAAGDRPKTKDPWPEESQAKDSAVDKIFRYVRRKDKERGGSRLTYDTGTLTPVARLT